MGETSQKTAGLTCLELGDAKLTESHASSGFSRNSMGLWCRLFKRTHGTDRAGLNPARRGLPGRRTGKAAGTATPRAGPSGTRGGIRGNRSIPCLAKTGLRRRRQEMAGHAQAAKGKLARRSTLRYHSTMTVTLGLKKDLLTSSITH